MEINNIYKRWIENLSGCPDLLKELENISDDEIFDRFWRELEFGTGGLRGEMGAGTNRMNVYTVGKATQGLAEYLLSISKFPAVAIAYDTRNMSKEFAHRTAGVLCANGIKVYLYGTTHPTPMLSFAVRFLKAGAGIVITASHNPKQYNGYKVYGADGGQITDETAAAILAKINAADVFDGVQYIDPKDAEKSGLLREIGEDIDSVYFEKVKALNMRRELLAGHAGSLKILYSPLHGSGNIPVRRVLKELGFDNVDIVKEQEQPDGNFPTAAYPNPEEYGVYKLAIEQAKKTDPDLIFATDPDCDRIGVLCKTPGGEFMVLTGNQTGILLCDYLLKTKKELGLLPQNAAVIKTVVTSGMAKPVCENYGAALTDVLTGFKYIGEKIGEWEFNHEYSFIFGFEESYGYLAGDFVRDKDAVIASAMIAEMALYYKQQGLSLYEALQRLYKQYGFYAEKLISISMPGKEGQQKIATLISDLRTGYAEKLKSRNIKIFEDYNASKRVFCGTMDTHPIHLPKSNVLKFIFEDESWLVLRPSGTEPKMKIYLGVRALDDNAAKEKLVALEELARGLV